MDGTWSFLQTGSLLFYYWEVNSAIVTEEYYKEAQHMNTLAKLEDDKEPEMQKVEHLLFIY
ncbi:hypothetical protein [Niallia sp. 03091]|uniref:hypothetical protein n=1 Tax=Niallia sp. 03091 TaxID=3458059 RepID=UPI004044A77A